LSGAAHADLEPFSFGASETIKHDNNVTRAPGNENPQGDWLSTTEFNAALDQAIGRQRVTANGAFDINRYKQLHNLDANTYTVAGALDWATIGDLTGAIGADSQRRQYFYGLNGELQQPGATASAARNLETSNHVFANAQLGGLARWSLFTGFDANERKYSNPVFASNEERQWSGHAGTNYSTSPDLSFGVQGYVTHGLYPKFLIGTEHDDFDTKSLDLTTKWQATGVSTLDASVGYTDANYTAQPSSHFVNGSLNWTWTPPSHITLIFGLSRDSSADTAISGSLVNADSLTGRSINNIAHLSVTYQLTPKTSFGVNTQYTQRRYVDAVIPTGTVGETETIDGSNRTTLFGLTAHFLPTRTTDVSCSVAREIRKSDASISLVTPSYTDSSFNCTALIRFD
jgi:hypothetical protein